MNTVKHFQEEYGEDKVMYQHLDVTNEQQRKDIFGICKATFGNVDILINNAGIGSGIGGGGTGSILKMFDVNVAGPMELTYLAADQMDKRKGGNGGVIVNISSIAGIETCVADICYHATKAAVYGFTKAYGESPLGLGKYEEHGIRLVTLCPSYTKTDLTFAFWDPDEPNPNSDGLKHIEQKGGWVDLSTVALTCIAAIEKELPQSSALEIVKPGPVFVYPNSMAGQKLNI